MTRRPEIQFTPDEQAAFLSQPHRAALATIDKEGFLHVVAMGHRYKDGVIYMTSMERRRRLSAAIPTALAPAIFASCIGFVTRLTRLRVSTTGTRHTETQTCT
jgi:hypothetical protein